MFDSNKLEPGDIITGTSYDDDPFGYIVLDAEPDFFDFKFLGDAEYEEIISQSSNYDWEICSVYRKGKLIYKP